MTNPTIGNVPIMEPIKGEFEAGYKAGKAAAEKIAIGKPFLGAHGYADRYAGSSPACRLTKAWRGAANGYLDGLPEAAYRNGVTVDAKGMITKIGR